MDGTIQPGEIDENQVSHINYQDKKVRSYHAQDIISRKPDFLERWSLLLFLILVILLAVSTWFIEYSETIKTNATLKSTRRTEEIKILNEGKVYKLFARNNMHVEKNSVIGWIENAADQSDVIELSRKLDSCEDCMTDNGLKDCSFVFDYGYSHLGSLESEYKLLKNSWEVIKISILKNPFDNPDEIAKRNMISRVQLPFSHKIANLLHIKTKEASRRYGVSSHERSDRLNALGLFKEQFKALKNLVDSWKHDYIITAPQTGTLFYLLPTDDVGIINQNKVIAYILPDSAQYYALILIQHADYEKISIGLPVQIRINAYPFEQLGYVEGKISYISNLPSDSGLLSIVKMENFFKTHRNTVFVLREDLKAQAIIITKKTRLFQRLYHNLFNTESNH